MLLPNTVRVVIGQLRVSSHQLEIENGRANGVPREERICRLCQIEIDNEYHFTCKCPTYLDLVPIIRCLGHKITR